MIPSMLIPAIVWVFVITHPGPERILPQENFDTQQTCQKHANARMKKTHEQIRCMRMENK